MRPPMRGVPEDCERIKELGGEQPPLTSLTPPAPPPAEANPPELFSTASAEHIARKTRLDKGRSVITKFSDGEIYCRVEGTVRRRSVWVLASTQPPGDNLLELAFLMDALKRAGARLNLMVTYFGYARQDRVVEKGEALSSKVVCDLLRQFDPERIFVVHMHSPRIARFLEYEDIIPTGLFDKALLKAEVVVAPDRGALWLARSMSRRHGLGLAYMEKRRPGRERVEITKLVGKVRGKRAVIVDDMISTGGTVIRASQRLMESGAAEVSAAATHGIFSGDALERLEESPIKSVYVTNTIWGGRRSRKIKTFDVSGFLEGIILSQSSRQSLSSR